MEKPTGESERLFVVHAFSGRRGRHPPQVPTGTSALPADGDVSAPGRRGRQRSRPTGTLALLAGVSSVLRVVLGLCHAAAEGAWCWLVFFQEGFAHFCES